MSTLLKRAQAGLTLQGMQAYGTGDTIAQAVLVPGSYKVYPLKLVNVIYQTATKLARQKGFELSLFTQTPVKSITRESSAPGRWRVNTSRGAVKTYVWPKLDTALADNLSL